MRNLSIAIVILFLTIQIAFSQDRSKLSMRFEYSTLSQQSGDTITVNLYYIIDSVRKIVYENEAYYSFVFSTSPEEFNGYIRFNKKRNCMVFISKFYEEENKCSAANKPQMLFSFSNSTMRNLCYIGYLGSPSAIETRIRKTEGKSIRYLKIKYRNHPPSDFTYIKSIEFENNLYPIAITLYDPVKDKDVRVMGILGNKEN